MMHSPGINGGGELRGQPADPGSPGKMAVKTECVCVRERESERERERERERARDNCKNFACNSINNDYST